ncbi:PREDICTED: uncharacterized protein LOC105146501 isoform X2 [Acromyrmex echinatior]|uniref:uncharacterized protein LOC105146501 isoform X2 n=1 Tax=Acromyrmex echinatior TaxID=103372 RepID=UPI000580E330|nr:PREDICTED: uncharacterized protein LOC105146501 isoform X2 [Acromyrmex echinatior]
MKGEYTLKRMMENNQSLYISLFSEEKSDVLKELLHACVDEICGRPGPSYRKFANSMDWSRAEYEGVYKLISSLLRNPTSLYMVEEKEHYKRKLPTVIDHNWRLKLVMGSSKMASLRESLLQLDLIIEDKGSRRIINLELNKDELDTIINNLEKLV